MGVHRVTSEAAKAYVKREKVLGNAISLLGRASTIVDELDDDILQECGDLAADLLPHAPGYAGKLMLVIARLFWSVAGVPHKDGRATGLDEVETRLKELENSLPGPEE